MPYPKFNSIFKDSFLEFFTTLLGDISIDLANGKSLLLPYKPHFLWSKMVMSSHILYWTKKAK
jgi:hypothetical protein